MCLPGSSITLPIHNKHSQTGSQKWRLKNLSILYLFGFYQVRFIIHIDPKYTGRGGRSTKVHVVTDENIT